MSQRRSGSSNHIPGLDDMTGEQGFWFAHWSLSACSPAVAWSSFSSADLVLTRTGIAAGISRAFPSSVLSKVIQEVSPLCPGATDS